MTQKEKAEELIYIFAQIIPPSSYVAFEEGVQINFDLENAKQCALIAIDEILNVCEKEIAHCSDKTYFYWQEVKSEIEKL